MSSKENESTPTKVEEVENNSLLKNFIDSIFNAGINKNIHNIARGVFVLAIISALTLVYLSNFNIHTIVLSFLLIGLFCSVEL